MKKIISLCLACVLFCLTLCACVKTQAYEPKTDPIEGVNGSLSADTFDQRFLDYIASTETGNYMVSPLSFRYALGLLLAGAEGQTKTELLQAFGVEDEEEWAKTCTLFNGFMQLFDEQLQEEIAEYREYVQKGYCEEGQEPFRALKVANSIWKRSDISEDFKDAFKEKIGAWYVAEYKDFTLNNVVSRVNQWASDKTEKMIERLLPDDYDVTNLAVILMNALYFKDSWCESFNKTLTCDGDFTKADGTKVTKSFMHKTEMTTYYEDEDTQLIVLPMNGGVYMAFVLGSTQNLSEKVKNADRTTVSITLPKMDMETTLDNGELMAFLKHYGVSSAFLSSADFSGMIDYEVYVSDIIQKTRIKLDEEGVEAAAVTSIMMKENGIEITEPKTFCADRPFTFYVYTTVNDVTEILFAGQMVE